MKALILAAGFGVRLREIIHGRPKHLAPVNGQPFLRLLLKLLKRKGLTDVVLSIGYLSQYIIDEFEHDREGLNLSFSESLRPLGTAGSIKLAKNYFKEDFLILNGDTYLDIDYQALMQFHQKHKALLTLVGTSQSQQKGSIIKTNGHQVKDFIFRPKNALKARYRHAGIYVASPKIFSYIPEITKYSIEKDLIKDLFKKNQSIYLYKTNKNFIDIGSPEQYQKAITRFI